jgi:hypothetical protein
MDQYLGYDMTEISLNQHIAIGDLSPWLSVKTPRVTFRLTKAASFDPGIEGVAIGVLRHLVLSGMSIHVKCAFRPVDDHGRPQGILDGLFGVHLLFAARTAIIEGDEREDVRATIVQNIWKYVRANQGDIGDGRKRSIIFRDPDYSIPECLRESVAARFPLPNKFNSLLTKMSRHIAGTAGELSDLPAEEAVASFLYEAALNAHEHARRVSDEAAAPPTVIRGVILEKLFFNSQNELHRRGSLSTDLREYLVRVWSSGPTHMSFLSATVADLGPGIQNTLTALPGESSWERLNRAFRSGVTSKPEVPDRGLGEGLTHILDAALRLKAYLIVTSAELVGIRDCSCADAVREGQFLRASACDWTKSVGTSLTVIWPVRSGRGSQGQLFPA